MSNDYLSNPLAYDEQIIAEKLGIYDYSNKYENDVNTNLKIALLEEELRNSKTQLNQLKKSTREQFVPNKKQCKCSQSDNSDVDDFLDFNNKEVKKIVLFLIILLVAFCVFQYMAYKSESQELMQLVYLMLQSQQNAATHGQVPTSNIASTSNMASTSAQPSTPVPPLQTPVQQAIQNAPTS